LDHRIATISDPNCPYCRTFERDLAQVDDITIHIFIYPVIQPESVRQAKSVWCSKDRAKAWNDLMLEDVQPTATTDCPNPLKNWLRWARSSVQRPRRRGFFRTARSIRVLCR